MDNLLIFYPIFQLSSFAIKDFLTVVNNIGSQYLTNKIRSKNNEILFLISALNLDSLFISLTNSNSILYRFKFIDTKYEFKWEVFLDDEDDCAIQSILHIYQDQKKVKSTYGSIQYIYELINATVYDESLNSFIIENYSPEIYKNDGHLSSAFSTY